MERFLIATLGFLLLSFQIQARDPLEPEDAAKVIKQFQYDGVYTEIKNTKKGGSFDQCWVYDIQFETEYPGATEPLLVNMKVYRPNPNRTSSAPIPAVVILPPIGGVNMLDKRTAKTLCGKNMAGMIVSNDFANIEKQAAGKLNPPEDHQDTFYRVTAAIKGIVKMVEMDDQLDANKVGIFGASLGGILSSFVMATQPDIAAGYFVVAGGDIPEILAKSDQEKISKIRRKRMREENLQTVEEYEDYLRQYVTLDPIDISLTMAPETLNMVISNRDATVPSANQMALHKAFGEPETIYSNDNHTMTIISFLFPNSGRLKVANFFEDRFELENPRPDFFNFVEPELHLASY